MGGRKKRGAAISNEAKQREVLQLLKDFRPFLTPFGGARPLDETHVSEAAYGPGGYVEAGAEFEKRDLKLLTDSLRHLKRALRIVREHDYNAWASLIEPYLGDTADPGVIDDRRKKIKALDQENAEIRRQNAERERLLEEGGKAAKKAPAYRHEKTRLVVARAQLDRHDRAIKQLAHHLRNVELHVVYPRLMSEREEAAGELANAQVYAYYQRVRVAGRTHRGAISQTAVKFGIPEGEVERIVEFRSDAKLATCAEPGCGGEVYQQNLCQKHYQREYRARKKSKAS